MVSTYAVAGTVKTPAGGARQASVLIELVTDPGRAVQLPGYVDANDEEILGTLTVTADPTTGDWTAGLYANADVRPSNTYYRATYIVDGIAHQPITFQVAAAGWVGDMLVATPAAVSDVTPSGRQIAFTRVTSTASITSTATADLANASITVPVGTRPIVLEYSCGFMSSTVADTGLSLYWFDVTAGVTLVTSAVTFPVAGYAPGPVSFRCVLDPQPAPGNRNYKIRVARVGSSGTISIYGDTILGIYPHQQFLRAVEG